jgi:hypothetical protein
VLPIRRLPVANGGHCAPHGEGSQDHPTAAARGALPAAKHGVGVFRAVLPILHIAGILLPIFFLGELVEGNTHVYSLYRFFLTGYYVFGLLAQHLFLSGFI